MLLRDHNSLYKNRICLKYFCPEELITQISDNKKQMSPDWWAVQGNKKKTLDSVTGNSSQGTINLGIATPFIALWKSKNFGGNRNWSEDNEVVLQMLAEASGWK